MYTVVHTLNGILFEIFTTFSADVAHYETFSEAEPSFYTGSESAKIKHFLKV